MSASTRDYYVDGRARRVLERIGQAFLDHPVGDVGGRIAQAVRRTGEPAAYGQSRRTCPGDELTDQPDTMTAAVLRAMPGQLDQAAYLRFCLPRELTDGVEGLGRQGRVSHGQPLPGTRLDHHHADAVRHDVMQLARDPGPL